jgi:hypothetical protein
VPELRIDAPPALTGKCDIQIGNDGDWSSGFRRTRLARKAARVSHGGLGLSAS